MLLSLFPIYLFSQVFIHLAFNRLTSKKLKIRKYCYRHSLCRISKQPSSLLANTELRTLLYLTTQFSAYMVVSKNSIRRGLHVIKWISVCISKLWKTFTAWFSNWLWIRNNRRNGNATTRRNSKIHSTRLHQGGDLFSNTQCKINSSECFVPSKWFSEKKTLQSIQDPNYLHSELFKVLNWFSVPIKNFTLHLSARKYSHIHNKIKIGLILSSQGYK